MVADEPDFQKYPETIAEFTGVVAKYVSGCLLKGATWLLDGLRHVAVPHCVQRAVRGWEGRVWEVGDGEVDGPVAPSGRRAEWELVSDPGFVSPLAEPIPRIVQKSADFHDVGVCLRDDPISEVRSD